MEGQQGEGVEAVGYAEMEGVEFEGEESSSYDSSYDSSSSWSMDEADVSGSHIPPVLTPRELWEEFLQGLANATTLRIGDESVVKYGLLDEGHDPQEICNELLSTIRINNLTHIILGKLFFNLIRDEAIQQSFLKTLLIQSADSKLKYLKLGSDATDVENPFLKTPVLLDAMLGATKSTEHWKLTEIELRGLVFMDQSTVEQMCLLLSRMPSITQINLFGASFTEKEYAVDPLLQTATKIPSLDELQINRTHASNVPLIRSETLEKMFEKKPKWWRLGLDGLGLTDAHALVMSSAFTQKDTQATPCKVGDLLTLKMNPAITALGYNSLFQVLYNKQRMGLVKVDHVQYQATFDLVRSMNNLHRRLEFRGQDCEGWKRDRWIDFLETMSKLRWEDDCHKLNYIWFTVLERPDFVHQIS